MDLRVLGRVLCFLQMVAALLTVGPHGQQSWPPGHTASAAVQGPVLRRFCACFDALLLPS